MDTCTLLAVGPVRLRAPLGGAVHLSHGVIQATADPWLGEGRLPLHPCSPAAGDASAPRSPGTWLLNYVLCVASFRPCPASCLPSTPTSTGPLLPRMLTHRSPLVTCAVGLAAAWACAALGPQLLGLGRSDGSPPPHGGGMLKGVAGSTRETQGAGGTSPGFHAGTELPGGAQASARPLSCHHWSVCSFLRLLQLPHAGAGAGSSAPPAPAGAAGAGGRPGGASS